MKNLMIFLIVAVFTQIAAAQCGQECKDSQYATIKAAALEAYAKGIKPTGEYLNGDWKMDGYVDLISMYYTFNTYYETDLTIVNDSQIAFGKQYNSLSIVFNPIGLAERRFQTVIDQNSDHLCIETSNQNSQLALFKCKASLLNSKKSLICILHKPSANNGPMVPAAITQYSQNK